MLQSPIHDQHAAAEATFLESFGFDMPASFASALDEALAARTSAAIFDLTHFGRFDLAGDGALALLERLFTADHARQEDFTARYSIVCNDRGGILADAWVLRLDEGWTIIIEPACREKLADYLRSAAADMSARFTDRTTSTAMLAAVGPAAAQRLDAVTSLGLAGLPNLAVHVGDFAIARYVATRVCPAGGWGVFVILPNMLAPQAWRFVTASAAENRFTPAGLAAWEILRIEAGTARYGYEINETIDPYLAGLADAVSFDHDFVGADALRRLAARPPQRRRIGLRIGRSDLSLRVPSGSPILDADGCEIGSVTSAAWSPALSAAIAMAYVRADAAQPGQSVAVQTGPDRHAASIAELPFFRG